MSYDDAKTVTFDATSMDPAGSASNGFPGKEIPLKGSFYNNPTEVVDPFEQARKSSAGDTTETVLDVGEGEEFPEDVVPMNYCVGWLLAISGPNKGRSYELHACQNHVGRGEDCGVRIMADGAVSRNQVVIVYDSVTNEYSIYSDRGSAISRLNGKRLTSGELPLGMGDVIWLTPRTSLMFVPACFDKFRWK